MTTTSAHSWIRTTFARPSTPVSASGNSAAIMTIDRAMLAASIAAAAPPVPIAMPTVGRQRGRVVYAVADHRHRDRGGDALDRAGLVRGQLLSEHVGDAGLPCERLRCADCRR